MHSSILPVFFRKTAFFFLVFTLCCLIMCPDSATAQNLSPLAPSPAWKELEAYHDTMTREEFTSALQQVYASESAYSGFLTISHAGVQILTNTGSSQKQSIFIRFAPNAANRSPLPRYWKQKSQLSKRSSSRPLQGLTVALDPGHIGGNYAKMEERWFQIGKIPPVMEGNMSLKVAELLAPNLERLGAKVVWVRKSTQPVTSQRPKDFRDEAIKTIKSISRNAIYDSYSGPNDPRKFASIQWQSELLFYRTSEIRARAQKVNAKLKPDIVLCLHFNAEAWGDPASPQLVNVNHFHLLVNGTYGRSEIALDDVRFDMLQRIFQRIHEEEIPLSQQVARSMAKINNLPPYIYTGSNARKMSSDNYVWARNLLANRLYQCPVVFLEPYVMNSEGFFQHFQLGEYSGTREVRGAQRPNIYQEYTNALIKGLVDYYHGQ